MAGFKPWTGDLDGMTDRRLIRILVPFSKTLYFIDKGREYGVSVELGQALEKWLNADRKKATERIRIAFIPTARDRLLPALEAGLGDIVAANLTITEERLKSVDFTEPLARKVSEVLVTGPAAGPVPDLEALAGKEVMVRYSSSYHESLEALNQRWSAEGKSGQIVIRPSDEALEDEDLMEMVNAGLLPWCVVDRYKAEIWTRVFTNLTVRDDLPVAEDRQIAWAIRKNSPALKQALDKFVAGHRVGTTFGNILRKRFYRDTTMVKRAFDPKEQEKFLRLVELFNRHGTTYEFDTLMLVAQGYQESQLDQSRRSKRGAVGIMQILPTTAADKSVGITGIANSEDRNIEAGSKYLRFLADTYLGDEPSDRLNRTLLALAAYNAGPGNLRKFRAKTIEMGLDPNIWFNNVEQGAAMIVGRETVQYVGNIYKYYVAYQLLEEARKRNAAVKADAPD